MIYTQLYFLAEIICCCVQKVTRNQETDQDVVIAPFGFWWVKIINSDYIQPLFFLEEITSCFVDVIARNQENCQDVVICIIWFWVGEDN